MTTRTKQDSGAMILLVLLLLFPLILWNGFAFSVLWDWFSVPLGMPHISTPHAAGLMMLVGLAFGSKSTTQQASQDMWDNVGRAIVLPAMALGLGFLLHLLMG